MKRLLTAFLAVILTASLLLPAQAAFPDADDPAVAQSAELLQMLGVVAGYPDGTLRPSRGLTRAEFCALAIRAMGKEDQLALYTVRTIFPDVRANHWARSYINLAAAGEQRIIAGTPDGRFLPDDPVTYAQAVTILMRILGYTDADAGMLWPQGYLALAAGAGLTARVKAEANAPLTRGQTVLLLADLLSCARKTGGEYITTFGTLSDEVLVLDAAEKAGVLTVRTQAREYTVAGSLFPREYLGLRGKLLLNDAGEIRAFLPTGGRQDTVVVAQVNAAWVVDLTGRRHTLTAEIPVYSATGETTWGGVWLDLKAGDTLTLYYNDKDEPDAIFRGATSAEEAVVVRGSADADTFRAITGGEEDYLIFKNGRQVQFSDLRPYDVATYADGVLRVNGSHITAICETMTPNEQSPLSVTAFGHTFPVLLGAIAELTKFRTSDEVTLLLTADGRIAGAVSPSALRCETIGLVTADGGDTASVTLLHSELTIENVKKPGADSGSAASRDQLGQLVRVFRDETGAACLSRIRSGDVPGTLLVPRKRVGAYPVSADCALFDRVGDGPLTAVTWDDLSHLASVPASSIAYCRIGGDGQVDVLVFKDVTGNCYEYGFLLAGTAEQYGGGEIYRRHTAAVRNGKAPRGSTPYVTLRPVTTDVPGGVAAGMDGNAANIVTLQAGESVRRTDFQRTEDGAVTVTCAGRIFRVASDVQCYNARGKSWFASLDEARAFADTLTVCRDPIAGAVRLVIAE